MVFEYESEEIAAGQGANAYLLERMNARGIAGWSFVQVVATTPDVWVAYFQREWSEAAREARKRSWERVGRGGFVSWSDSLRSGTRAWSRLGAWAALAPDDQPSNMDAAKMFASEDEALRYALGIRLDT